MKILYALLAFACLSLGSTLVAQEAVDLTTPYTPVPAVSKMQVIFMAADWENNRLVIVLGHELSTVASAGKTGTLSTRTSNQVGVLTLEAGHGLVVDDRVNVAWTAGGAGSRIGMKVTVVSGNDVTVSGGNGNQLPVVTSAVTTPTYTRSYPTRQEFSYTGSEATKLLRQINTWDLSANSLHKRIVNRLIADGKLAGTVSGNPE